MGRQRVPVSHKKETLIVQLHFYPVINNAVVMAKV
jgi:hypothetical protein